MPVMLTHWCKILSFLLTHIMLTFLFDDPISELGSLQLKSNAWQVTAGFPLVFLHADSLGVSSSCLASPILGILDSVLVCFMASLMPCCSCSFLACIFCSLHMEFQTSQDSIFPTKANALGFAC